MSSPFSVHFVNMPLLHISSKQVKTLEKGQQHQRFFPNAMLLSWHFAALRFRSVLFLLLQTLLTALRAADVVVVISGVDGALAPVVAALVDSPVVRGQGVMVLTNRCWLFWSHQGIVALS